jgi:hypothetical protein
LTRLSESKKFTFTQCHSAHVELETLRKIFAAKKFDAKALQSALESYAILKTIDPAPLGGPVVPECANFLYYVATEIARAPNAFCVAFAKYVPVWDLFGRYVGKILKARPSFDGNHLRSLYNLPRERCERTDTDYAVRAQAIAAFDPLAEAMDPSSERDLSAAFWDAMETFLQSCRAAVLVCDCRLPGNRRDDRPQSVQNMVSNLLRVWVMLTREHRAKKHKDQLQWKAAENSAALLSLVDPNRMDLAMGLKMWEQFMRQLELPLVLNGQQPEWPLGVRNSMQEALSLCQSWRDRTGKDAINDDARDTLNLLVAYLRGNFMVGDRRQPRPGHKVCRLTKVGSSKLETPLDCEIKNICNKSKGRFLALMVSQTSFTSPRSEWRAKDKKPLRVRLQGQLTAIESITLTVTAPMGKHDAEETFYAEFSPSRFALLPFESLCVVHLDRVVEGEHGVLTRWAKYVAGLPNFRSPPVHRS